MCDPRTGCNCPCQCPCGGPESTNDAPALTGPNGKALSIKTVSQNPIRYANGEIELAVDDLSTAGYGYPWGHTRIYSNRLSSDYDFGNGYNWLIKQGPYLVQQNGGNTIVVMRGVDSSLWFDLVAGAYVGRYGTKHKLSHSSSVFNLIGPNGAVWQFYDFLQTAHPAGAFASHTTAGGQTTSAIYALSGQLAYIQRTYADANGVTTFENYQYEYVGDDISSVTVSRVTDHTVVNIRQMQYDYYGSGDPNGSSGDLKQAQLYLWLNGAWSLKDTSYYRYWVGGSNSSSGSSGSSSAPNTSPHLLKFVVNSDAYIRLVNAGITPQTAGDSQLAAYADMYFEYDGQRRVTKEVVQGGVLSYRFSYIANAGSSGSSSSSSGGPPDIYNTWSTKTVEEVLGSGFSPLYTNTVYTNSVGDVMLKQLVDNITGEQWTTYSRFDSNTAEVVLYANPSAVASFDESQGNLGVSLRVASGLIRTYVYYGSNASSSSSSSSGGVAAPGYLAAESVQQGTGGTPVLLKQYEYSSQSAGGATIYPVAAETVYRDDGSSQPMTTSYSYAFYSGTSAVNQRTTTWSTVPINQNGSGTADSRVEVFDPFGNVTWLKDERGFITAFQYDIVTGAMLARIDDAGQYLPLAVSDVADFGYPTHTHKNWLINGDFRIWQRAGSFTPSASGKAYTADRWCYTNTGTPSGLIVRQESFATGQTSVPNDPRFYLEAAQTGSGSGTFHTIEQRIEDVRNFSGLNVVLSFWAKADANRTLNTQFTQCFGTGGSPSANVTTAPQANSLTTAWGQFICQIALPSIAGKSLGTNDDHYLAVQFSLPTGTAFTIDLANVQLEIGFDATDFERRLLAEEMVLCQRYYQRCGKLATFVFFSSTSGVGQLALPVALRSASPALAISTSAPAVVIPGTNIYTGASAGASLTAGSNLTAAQFEIGLTGFTGAVASKPAFLYDDYVTLDAEL